MECIAIRPSRFFKEGKDSLVSPWLVLQDGVLRFIGSELPSKYQSIPKANLANGVLIPGLCNAHCHLEFSDLGTPLPFRGSFTEWIRDVVQHRRDLQQSLDVAEHRRNSITRGLLESYQSGTKWIVDTVTSPWRSEWIEGAVQNIIDQYANAERPWYRAVVGKTPIHYLPCLEVLDINPSRKDDSLRFVLNHWQSELERAGQFVDSGSTPVPETSSEDGEGTIVKRFAVSPHAPYTTTRSLVQQVSEWAHLLEGIVSMHLAESNEELEWLSHRSGPMESSLKAFRDASFYDGVGSMKDYLDQLLLAPSVLIAHGNGFDALEIEKIAMHHQHAAIVHCPRTFRHFHPDEESRYPLLERIECGVSHLIGTDSRASNPDLNLWEELRCLYAEHSLSSESILSMASSEAGRILRIPAIGKCRVGHPIDLNWVQFSGELSSEEWQSRIFHRTSQALPLELALSKNHFESQ